MNNFSKDVIVALVLGVLGNALYALVTQRIDAARVILISVVIIFAYYLLIRLVLKPRFAMKKSGIENVYESYKYAKTSILTSAKQAKTIKLTTIGGGTIFEVDWGEFTELLEIGARGGTEIKILALQPNSLNLSKRIVELNKFKPGKFNLEEFKMRIQANVLKVKDLNTRLGNNKIQLRYYDILPTWRLYIFDNIMFISSYLKDKEGHDTVTIEISKENDLYRAFDREFEYLWSVSEIPPELRDENIT